MCPCFDPLVSDHFLLQLRTTQIPSLIFSVKTTLRSQLFKYLNYILKFITFTNKLYSMIYCQQLKKLEDAFVF